MNSNYNFDYLIDKIASVEFSDSPFKHVYIEEFFSEDHFDEIVNSPEILPPDVTTDEELIDSLYHKGFKAIPFPGCIVDVRRYIDWHSHGKQLPHHSACEGFGMALRLYEMKSPILRALNDFITSQRFNQSIANKFSLNFSDCVVDGGIQKYLDGYEISPHPDIRKKAATFMINVNPSTLSDRLDHHTHYLRLKPSKKYVQEFWEGNPDIERVWLPWSWCESDKQQSKNNSIVIFSPSNDTFHGVKARYDHLVSQRTQLYGNLWYKECLTKGRLDWEELDLEMKAKDLHSKSSFKKKSMAMFPATLKETIKGILGRHKKVGKRNI